MPNNYCYSHRLPFGPKQYNKPYLYKINSEKFNKQNKQNQLKLKLQKHCINSQNIDKLEKIVVKEKEIQIKNALYNNISFGWNIKKMTNGDYNIIIKKFDSSYNYYEIENVFINSILISFYSNIIQSYYKNNKMISHIALILAYITLTINEGKEFYNKLQKNNNIKTIDAQYINAIGNKIMLNFVNISEDILGLKSIYYNDIIDKNLIIVAKILNKLNFDFTNYYDSLLNYSILHDAITKNNYLLIEYILEIIKLQCKNINKIYSGCLMEKNLVDHLVNETIFNIKFSNYDNYKINAELKIYYLLLKYGAAPVNSTTLKKLLSKNNIINIKIICECFYNMHHQYLTDFIYEIKLIFYPKVIINVILNYV
jgi:hypothetical protein